MDFQLSFRERSQLEAIVAKPDDPKQLKRAQALLGIADGERAVVVAGRLQVSHKTIYNWIDRFRDRPEKLAERLQDRQRSGRPPDKFEQTKEQLSRLMETLPNVFGYARSQWTTELLMHHLLVEHDLAASETTVRRGLHELGFRWKRPRLS